MKLPKQRVVPALRITDYERSKAYCIERLGFTVEWEHRFGPHIPAFMSLVCDGMQIYLTQHSGGSVAEAPNNDLGFRNMIITDPDGNQLRFIEPSSKNA